MSRQRRATAAPPPDFRQDYAIRFRLDDLLRERGIQTDYETGEREAARRCGLHFNVIRRMRLNTATRIDLDTIMRLCLGLRCSPNDLFEIDVRDDDTNEK